MPLRTRSFLYVRIFHKNALDITSRISRGLETIVKEEFSPKRSLKESFTTRRSFHQLRRWPHISFAMEQFLKIWTVFLKALQSRQHMVGMLTILRARLTMVDNLPRPTYQVKTLIFLRTSLDQMVGKLVLSNNLLSISFLKDKIVNSPPPFSLPPYLLIFEFTPVLPYL